MICILNGENSHVAILILIMLVSGSFGGYLNYLHNFDTKEKQSSDHSSSLEIILKYILLGICAAFIVPAFLNMISSDLIREEKGFYNYLVFTGFCLIASIFSRRFITTIGEKILETAKSALIKVEENNEKVKEVKKEIVNVSALTSDQIEVTRLSLANLIKSNEIHGNIDQNSEADLLVMTREYVSKTSVPEYAERIKLKSELGRKMGKIVVDNNLDIQKLLNNESSEGLNIAISYAIQIKPMSDQLQFLNTIAKRAKQLFTKFSVLVAYNVMLQSGLIDSRDKEFILKTVHEFKKGADKFLLAKIQETEKSFKIN